LNNFDEDFASHLRPLSEMNIIPLVDVMLVLLILFMITAPLLTLHAVKIDIPQVSSQPSVAKSETIDLAMEAKGTMMWNEERINAQELAKRLRVAARKNPQPEFHLRVAKTTPYQYLAELLAAIQQAGITQIGFVTKPK